MEWQGEKEYYQFDDEERDDIPQMRESSSDVH